MEAPTTPSPTNEANESPSGSTKAPADGDKRKEEIISSFAEHLGAKTGKNVESVRHRSKELTKFFADQVSNEDVVLTLPSLDMRLDEGQETAVLPEVGDSKAKQVLPDQQEKPEESVSASSSSGGESRPIMAASVLSGATEGAANIEQKAAQNLGNGASWTKSTLVYASQAVAANVSDSFASLVDSRVRAWTLLLLRHSLSTGDAESRSRLLSMLSACIKVDSAETKFKTLPLPESAANEPKEADVILPLLFEVVLHITLQNRTEMLTLHAPGTITADFATKDSSKGLKKVEIRLDTGEMLKSMVDQARIVVFKAVATATKAPVPAASSQPVKPEDPDEKMAPPAPAAAVNTSGLAGFRSALNLSRSAAEQAPQLQKARASALRLNSVLHGKANESKTPSLGQRKIRSVKWDSPLQLPKLGAALAPSPKKQRMAQTAARLKSFKSFGRPHAGDFGSGPRNATFGEFGRQTFWGRDGRLAQHPMPQQVLPADDLAEIADKNATFDLHLERPKPKAGRPAASILRTPTAMENWLLKKSTGS